MGVDAEIDIKLNSPITDDELRILNNRLYEACGKDLLNQDRESGQRALSFGRHWDDEAPEQREWLYLNTWSRYYGEGYERGDWVKLRAIIVWLQHNVRSGDLYYYGDSIGRPDDPLGVLGVLALDLHWMSVSGGTYFNPGHSMFTRYGAPERDRICGFCGTTYTCNGVGGKKRLYHCCGCGQRAQLTEAGEFEETGDEKPSDWKQS